MPDQVTKIIAILLQTRTFTNECLGTLQLVSKCVKIKRVLLGVLGGGEVVWWLRQSSSSLLFRSFLGGDCVRGHF